MTDDEKLMKRVMKGLERSESALHKARAALRERLAQPEQEQEPVAEVKLMMTGGNAGLATRIVEIDDPMRERLRPGDKLFTTPQPQRKPQRKPLRSEEVYEICRRTLPKTVAGMSFVPEWAIPLARAIEAAHGIKEKP